jgi:hypothetical protein
MGRIETSDLKLITSEPMVGKAKAKPSTRAKWRSSLSACRGVEKKGLTESALLERRHILKLMLKDDFPKIWVPSWGNRDVRQLLWHRHRFN